MKPVNLAVRGFRSYPDPVTIDFTGKGLTAALGDTGAGKSSLLEAITFALFGKSSWDGRETKHLIADQAVAGSVDLTFTHGGHRWHVHRTIHATNSNAGRHHLKNMDTGDEVDGATPVTNRIEAVLQLGYGTFLRVGLLPQGKFDQLLTSAPRDRTKLLRELFGADSLASVQDVARDRCANLKELLAVAKSKRLDIPTHPEETAAEAGAKAAAAEDLAARLSASIDAMNKLQEQVSAARTAAEAAQVAARRLADGVVHDVAATLDRLEPVAERLETQRATLEHSASEIADREAGFAAEIQQREHRGEGLGPLTKAATILEHLAARVDTHRVERRNLDVNTAQLAADGDQIASDEAELNIRIEKARPLIDAAAMATEVGREVRSREGALRGQIADAMKAALGITAAVAACGSATGELEEANKAVARLEQEIIAVEDAVTRAEERQSALDLHNRAALVAADLHPGDDCPVCQQQVPDPFEAGSTASAEEIRKAKAATRDARRRRDKISDELGQCKARVTAALRAVSNGAENRCAAESEARRSADATRAKFDEFSTLAARVGGSFDAAAASAALDAAMGTLAVQSDRHAPHQHLAEPIISALVACDEAVSAHLMKLRDAESLATNTITVERELLVSRRSAYAAATEAASSSSSRETDAIARTAADIHALPSRIRCLLPSEVVEITSDSVEKALSAVAAGKSEIESLLSALEAGRVANSAILTRQRDLEQETNRLLARPLATLRSELDAWGKELLRAIHHFDRSRQHQVPRTPAEPGISEVRAFAADLLEITAAVDTALSGACAAHAADLEKATANLVGAAAQLADVADFDAAADMTTAKAVHPFIDARAVARGDAERWREIQRAVTAQIQQAADLDFAIAAGQARIEALDVLRRELVDARFLGYLTKLNTRALLGIASALLGQLTDNQFGFADNCDIVSRNSKVVHSANRLSGGEKFLASLALALALSELHSRSGPRLGSLFLDEGFATLDTAALQSALDVLRAQTGGDRLVMVISHLHAVAEAVDDVLWVERPIGGGSAARWLTADERDRLINADLSSGLQMLA
ncbi:SMC family ATPase [Nocardia uniformis]|uniref:Nuclease SbcCD subunit C n=1 Tax=Nocardia uniformis TaxID=53432 RepID=A0A849C7Y8_9NOCA|nr:SMC family ATPase [Nocardia uniformis]NNH73858.1 SMC family ATPase [Nocardia uniformis]